LPQPGQLTTLLTSFNAFPANCLCLFFEWEVFFFGTAFRTPSHKSDNIPGMFNEIAGKAIDAVANDLGSHDGSDRAIFD